MKRLLSPNRHPVDKRGLILWYDYMNSGSVSALGSWKDYSGKGYHGTLVNDAYVDNQGAHFDGTGDAVTNSSNAVMAGKAQVTVSVWVKFNAFASFVPLVNFSDSVNGFSLEERSDGEIRVYVGNGTALENALTTDFNLVVDTWYNIVGTYDGSTIRAYKNGVVSTVSTAQTGTIGTPTDGLAIGADNGLSIFFDGMMDCIQIYDRALSANEIKLNYLKNKRG